MNVHHKCQKKVANLCGVNQKLMAEALAIIESKQQVRQTNLLFFQNVFGVYWRVLRCVVKVFCFLMTNFKCPKMV